MIDKYDKLMSERDATNCKKKEIKLKLEAFCSLTFLFLFCFLISCGKSISISLLILNLFGKLQWTFNCFQHKNFIRQTPNNLESIIFACYFLLKQVYNCVNKKWPPNLAILTPINYLDGTWWTARIAIARKICSTRFYYCSTPFEQ